MTDNERIERVQANIIKACSSFKAGSTAADYKHIKTNKSKSLAQKIKDALLVILIGGAVGLGIGFLLCNVILPMMWRLFVYLFMEYIAPHPFIIGGIMGLASVINEIMEEKK